MTGWAMFFMPLGVSKLAAQVLRIVDWLEE